MAAVAQNDAAEEKRIYEPEDDEEFGGIKDKLKGQLVILDMGAAWCNPCKQLSKILPDVIKERAGFYIVKVDVDDCDETAEAYGMLDNPTLPTLIFVKFGEENEEIARQPGVKDKKALLDHIEKHFGIS